MFHGISGWEALVVGGTTFLIGMNGYAFAILGEGEFAGAVPMATVTGCALGGAFGELLAQLIYGPSKYSGRGKDIFSRMVWTGLAAGLGAGIGGGLLYLLLPNAGNVTAAAALGALSAVIASGKLGFTPPA